ncbi:STM3941 family protein [Erysipelotrichaceae bacterium 66-17]
MKNEHIVYQSKLKQAGLSVLGIFMVFMSLMVFLGGVIETNWLMLIIGLIALVFFGFCEFYIVKQLFHGKKLVVLTEKGFYDYSTATATKDRLIPWNEIAQIEDKSIMNQSFVSVTLKDPDKLLSSLSGLQKKSIAANVKLGFGQINVNLQSAKQCDNQQLIAMMKEFMSTNMLPSLPDQTGAA